MPALPSIILRIGFDGHVASAVDWKSEVIALLIACFFKLNLSLDGIGRSWVCFRGRFSVRSISEDVFASCINNCISKR